MPDQQKLYLILVRYITQHGRITKSEMVIQAEHSTFAAAEQAARGMNLKTLAKNYKLLENDVLVGVRIELFVKTEKDEKRLRTYTLQAEPENRF